MQFDSIEEMQAYTQGLEALEQQILSRSGFNTPSILSMDDRGSGVKQNKSYKLNRAQASPKNTNMNTINSQAVSEPKTTGFGGNISFGTQSQNSVLLTVGAVIVAIIATLGINKALSKPKRRR